MPINTQWDKKFEVGHPRIDHEHQVFLDLIRNVSLASERQESDQWTTRLLEEIKKYAEFHFLSEENIMFRIDYPEYNAHHKQHLELLATLADKIHRFSSGQIELDSVVDFLFEWFAIHTTQTDKKLAQYLNQSCD